MKGLLTTCRIWNCRALPPGLSGRPNPPTVRRPHMELVWTCAALQQRHVQGAVSYSTCRTVCVEGPGGWSVSSRCDVSNPAQDTHHHTHVTRQVLVLLPALWTFIHKPGRSISGGVRNAGRVHVMLGRGEREGEGKGRGWSCDRFRHARQTGMQRPFFRLRACAVVQTSAIASCAATHKPLKNHITQPGTVRAAIVSLHIPAN